MRTPRDINAKELVSLLEHLGYAVVRQTGSHISLYKSTGGGEHKITVPNHKPIKIGTLHGIANDVCRFNNIDIGAFYKRL
ncbi:MAG: type II toxin-antitoxin system HicA family toxin [Oscillospiraceae bacterium]|jgi:predicted RNA binding protein YcfA (HicA-like mRNA interferase family)|nr:type II toxin-antitoxin system HicA family toxin [Oscillospiraceae bacterium]